MLCHSGQMPKKRSPSRKNEDTKKRLTCDRFDILNPMDYNNIIPAASIKMKLKTGM